MYKKLILITRQFPYGNSENFLESEIIVLSRHFREIVIYPSTSANSIRPLPNNVTVSDQISTNYERNFYWPLRSLISKHLFKTIMRYGLRVKSVEAFGSLMKYVVSYNIYQDFAKFLTSDKSQKLIYSYWYNPAVDALVKRKSLNEKIICRVHRGDIYEETTLLGFYPFRELTIHHIDQIYSISEHGYKYLTEKYNVDNVSISRLGTFDHHMLNVVDDSTFSIVSVSNMIPIKRVDLIAKVVLDIAIRNPKANFVWNHFGDGVEDGKIRDTFNVNKPVNLQVILNGRVSNKAVHDFYKSNPVNVFINLSESEGIPVSIMEAISFGIPIVATDVGATSEIVNSTTGWLLPANPSLEEVVTAVSDAMSRQVSRSEIKEFWKGNYSAESNFLSFYQLICK